MTEGTAAREGAVLCLCGSRKPAPDRPHVTSASRELLREIRTGIERAGVPTEWLDARDLDLPFWDGRTVEEYPPGDLHHLRDCIAAATDVVLSAPAYWGGPSGVVKNMIDLLGSEPFRQTRVSLAVVGMDDAAAWTAAGSLRTTLGLLGAWVPPLQFVIGDPRTIGDVEGLRRLARRFGGYVVAFAEGRLWPPEVRGSRGPSVRDASGPAVAGAAERPG